jgi:diguanylate cyclase (GGDEF)-like protein
MARAMMYLFAIGASISLLALPFAGHAGSSSRLASTAGAGYLIAALLLVGYERLPRWSFQVFLACGTMLIEWTIYVGGENGSAFAMFYFWIAIYAFYFFSRAEAIAQLALIAVAYAAVLTFLGDPASGPVVRWAVTTSALVVAGAMIGLLKERVSRLIAQLADASRVDPVSGLFNTRALNEELGLEVERARRTKTSLSLIVGDVRCSVSNGHHGDLDPDAVLAHVGPAITAAVRPIDRAARLGQLRVAIIAGNSNDHGGYILAEGLQRAVHDALQTVEPAVAVDFGVASFPAHAGTAEDLVTAATAALERARGPGPERVVTYA